MRTDGKSIVQLVLAPRRFLNRFRANTASGVWQKEASTDRSSFEANTSLTFKEATSSITTEEVTNVESEKELDKKQPHRSIRFTPF